MPKYKVIETTVGPKRKWCTVAGKEKAVFPNYTAALSFLQEQSEGFIRHKGPFARSVYHCKECGGWHLTKQVPLFAEDLPGLDAIIIGGAVCTIRKVREGLNGCELCDADVVKKCHKGDFMPCLAYKEDVYFHKAELLTLAKRVYETK